MIDITQLKGLDLFCGPGGAAKGYSRAGFSMTGVDHIRQKAYPFKFIKGDALAYLLLCDLEVDLIHASPPCQGYSSTRTLHDQHHRHPKLIEPLRELLQMTGVPYVIENVEGARKYMVNPVMLCGSSFGLGVWRHRLFETSWPVKKVPPCNHSRVPYPVDVSGTGSRRIDDRVLKSGGNSRKPWSLAHAREVMGIDWMSRVQLAQAIPPAYTEFLAHSFLEWRLAVAS